MPDFILDTDFTVPNLPVDPPLGFSDNFNRADNASSLGYSSGESRLWQTASTNGAPTFGISGNALALTAATAGNAIAFQECYVSDGTLTATMLATGTVKGGGLAFRIQDGSNYYYLARQNASGPNFYYTLLKRVAGSATILNTSTTLITAGDVMSVVMNGSSIIVKVNGATLFSVTDTTFVTGTKHGVYTAGTGSLDGIKIDTISLALAA